MSGDRVEQPIGSQPVVFDHVGEGPASSQPGLRVVHPELQVWRRRNLQVTGLGFRTAGGVRCAGRDVLKHRCREARAGDFGEQRDHVVPPRVRAVRALPEAAVDLAPHHAGLAGLLQARGHRLAEQVDLAPDQRVDVRVRRVLERRNEDAGAAAAHLMLIEVHLGQPVAVGDPGQVARLDLREHVAVAVVVVSRVPLVQLRAAARPRTACRRSDRASRPSSAGRRGSARARAAR